MVIRDPISYSIILISLFAGCSSTHEILKNEATDQPASIDYSVIYYIHADAGYLYHDSDGRAVRANSRVLDTALKVAEEAYSGEVFIFYQRPENKFLGIFPQNRSRFYHYRNGRKFTEVKYRHSDTKEAFLTTEAQLYKQYGSHTQQEGRQLYLLYFGHEIPGDEGANYHGTLPDIEVNTVSFTGGIQQFLMTDDQRFNLVVLSTCNNGTPAVAELLMPVTGLLLASPQNLHLSHINSEPIGMLESEPWLSPFQIGYAIADRSYRRLSEDIQTTVTLALYDFEIVRPYIDELRTLTAAYGQLAQADLFQENADCAQFPFFNAEKYRAGVESWFKPARFGRGDKLETHSGWGCRPLSTNEILSQGVRNK